MSMEIVVASANVDKVQEISDILGDNYTLRLRPSSLPETIEDCDTLKGNAVKKAQEVSQGTGYAALADDTGLFVAALNGQPGVYSARYAGDNVTYEQNVAKLLAEMQTADERSAYFKTVVAFVKPDGSQYVFEGQVDGVIATQPKGAYGFGYDSVFVPNESNGQSFAEMSSKEKNSISHRFRALQAFSRWLEESNQ